MIQCSKKECSLQVFDLDSGLCQNHYCPKSQFMLNTCNFYQCTQLQSDNSMFCVQHRQTCLSVDCEQNKSGGSKYCKYHCCIVEDCDHLKLITSPYCDYHYNIALKKHQQRITS